MGGEKHMVAQGSEYDNEGDEIKAVQHEKLKVEIEKLKVEIDGLRSRWNRATKYVPLITLLIAVGSFWFGFYQVFSEYQRSKELSEKEFRREFYKKQLDVYLDLSNTTARISTTENVDDIQKSYQHFLELINGNLGIVQNGKVMDAAKRFDEAFKNKGGQDKLRPAALDIAAACRDSIKEVWQIPDSVYK
jgi:hypothetical protein